MRVNNSCCCFSSFSTLSNKLDNSLLLGLGDFILGDAEIAIEVKISHAVHKEDLNGLIAFCEEHHPKKAIVVSLDAAPRLLKINEAISIHILPWRHFLTALWQNEIGQ